MGHFLIGLFHGERNANHMKSIAYHLNNRVSTTNVSNFLEIRSILVTTTFVLFICFKSFCKIPLFKWHIKNSKLIIIVLPLLLFQQHFVPLVQSPCNWLQDISQGILIILSRFDFRLIEHGLLTRSQITRILWFTKCIFWHQKPKYIHFLLM